MIDGRKCAICGGKCILIHNGTRDNPLIDVYRCEVCGTKQLSKLAAGDYENGFMNSTKHMSQEEIKKRVATCAADDMRRFEQMKEICKGKTVLDFGCGFGGFLKLIKDLGNDSVGVELGSDEREWMKSQGINCVKTLDDLTPKYDIITLFHVFEHLEDPVGWLVKLRTKIKDNGKLFIEVPNADDALLELYESSEFADFTYWSAHLYLYTIESLKMIIEKSGCFEVKKTGQVQRYPIANHLMWLAKGKPGGQNIWSFINGERELNESYEKFLMDRNMCDTLFFEISPL